MDNHDAIIRLLTEIRDNQREEIAWRRKIIEESVHLQRLGVRRQMLGLVIVGLMIVAFLVWLIVR